MEKVVVELSDVLYRFGRSENGIVITALDRYKIREEGAEGQWHYRWPSSSRPVRVPFDSKFDIDCYGSPLP